MAAELRTFNEFWWMILLQECQMAYTDIMRVSLQLALQLYETSGGNQPVRHELWTENDLHNAHESYVGGGNLASDATCHLRKQRNGPKNLVKFSLCLSQNVGKMKRRREERERRSFVEKKSL
jgi:membrane-associated PAP2 superfamily phosphatase